MGVNRRFLLYQNNRIFSGPAAYYKLREIATTMQDQGYLPATYRIPDRGDWRKKIEPLYAVVNGKLGTGVAGRLRSLKMCNPQGDSEFRMAHEQIEGRRRTKKRKKVAAPRPETPPTFAADPLINTAWGEAETPPTLTDWDDPPFEEL